MSEAAWQSTGHLATSKAIFPVGQGASCNSEKSTKFTSRSPALATVGKWEKCGKTIDKTGKSMEIIVFLMVLSYFPHLFPTFSILFPSFSHPVLCESAAYWHSSPAAGGCVSASPEAPTQLLHPWHSFFVVPLRSASNLLLYELNRNSSALWV